MPAGTLDRRVALGLAVSAVLALCSVGLALGREVASDWRRVQREHAARTSTRAPGVREVAPWGEPERCLTCHLGIGGPKVSAGAKKPFGPHPPILDTHPPERDGCVACHGGAGRRLDTRGAHPTSGPDELRRGALLHVGCARCHTPGSVAGGRAVVDGIYAFVDLGCIACHRAGRLDAAAEFGPDLSTVGLRGSAYLRRAVREPDSLFPGTKMPGFAPALADVRREDALVAFLLTLRPGWRQSMAAPAQGAVSSRRGALAAGRASVPCVTCHAGGSPVGGRHRCVYILERGKDLACGRCHTPAPPRSTSPCPAVARRSFVCGACHEATDG